MNKIQSLYKVIAQGCFNQSPNEWQKCILDHRSIEFYSKTMLYFILPNGEEKYADDIEYNVFKALGELRTEMAQINNGEAWYTAIFTMTPDGKFKFDFDYDRLPAFDIMPEPHNWLDEFKKYPRPELQAQIQDWLDGTIGYDREDELVQRLADMHKR